jgi:hypothetical protein
MSERDWMAGQKFAYETLLAECVAHLGVRATVQLDDDGKKVQVPVAGMVERVAVVRVLRQVCERFGDNDWPDNLHLGDVIEKHLEPYLAKRRGGPR